MATKEYNPKAALSVGDLATIVDLGEAILPLEEFTVSAKNVKKATDNIFTIVSEGTSYRVTAPNGSHIANIVIDSDKGLVYDTELKKGKYNSAGNKFRADFYSSLDTIYDYALREIKNSGFNAEYLEKQVQNNSWVTLLLGIKVNEFAKQDPTTANGFANAQKDKVSKEDWRKAWDCVVKSLVENSTTMFAENVAKELESGELRKALKYLALLPNETISEFADQLRKVNSLNNQQVLGLKKIDLADLDEDDSEGIELPLVDSEVIEETFEGIAEQQLEDTVSKEGIEEQSDSNPTEYDPNEWGEIPSGQEVPPDFICEEE